MPHPVPTCGGYPVSRDTTRPVCVYSEQVVLQPFNSVLITSHRIQLVNYFLLLTVRLAALSIWSVLQHTRFILSTVLFSAHSEMNKPYQFACVCFSVFINDCLACWLTWKHYNIVSLPCQHSRLLKSMANRLAHRVTMFCYPAMRITAKHKQHCKYYFR